MPEPKPQQPQPQQAPAEVQKQLQTLGLDARASKKAADLMAQKGLSLTDILTHLPEILSLVEQIGGLFGKLWKKNQAPQG